MWPIENILSCITSSGSGRFATIILNIEFFCSMNEIDNFFVHEGKITVKKSWRENIKKKCIKNSVQEIQTKGFKYEINSQYHWNAQLLKNQKYIKYCKRLSLWFVSNLHFISKKSNTRKNILLFINVRANINPKVCESMILTIRIHVWLTRIYTLTLNLKEEFGSV